MEEAEELDTNEEPLLRREPLIERIDLESASSSLRADQRGRMTSEGRSGEAAMKMVWV